MSDEIARQLAFQLNDARRQLTKKDQEDVARQMREAGASSRTIAAVTGRSDSTERRKKSGGAFAPPDNPPAVEGSDKRHYPY